MQSRYTFLVENEMKTPIHIGTYNQKHFLCREIYFQMLSTLVEKGYTFATNSDSQFDSLDGIITFYVDEE